MNKTNFLTDYIKGNKLKGLMKGIKLSDLNYGDKEVKQVLLLFNILTVLQSNKSDMRFPFSKYKKEKWDIEHISSQTDKRINDDSQRLEWIHDMFEFLVGSTEEEDISAYVDNLKKEIQKIESKEKDKNIAKSKVDSKKEELILINRIAVLHSNSQREKINDTEFDECFDAVQKSMVRISWKTKTTYGISPCWMPKPTEDMAMLSFPLRENGSYRTTVKAYCANCYENVF